MVDVVVSVEPLEETLLQLARVVRLNWGEPGEDNPEYKITFEVTVGTKRPIWRFEIGQDKYDGVTLAAVVDLARSHHAKRLTELRAALENSRRNIDEKYERVVAQLAELGTAGKEV